MRRVVNYVLPLAIMFSSVVVNAQTAPTPNVQVRVYTVGAKNSTIETFAPGDPTPKDNKDYFSGLTVQYSQDGKWIGTYGLNEGSTAPQVTYGQVGQTPVQIPLPDQTTPIRMGFSPDSHYFGYTVLAFTTQQWTTGIVDLTSGKIAQFTGKSSPGPVVGDATPDLNVVQGMAVPLSWSPDDKLVYLESFIFSTAAARKFDGLYSLDASSLDFTKTDPQALPATTRLLSSDQIFGEPAISPDGTKAFYLSNDPANLPANYVPTKFSQTANTLLIVDLATGKSSTLVQTAKGEAFSTTQWLPDSKSIFYTTGGFQKTSYVVGPHVNTVDLATGKSTAGDVLENDLASYLVNALVCGDNIFFATKVYKDDFSGDTTLFSAPVSDVKSVSKPLIVGQNISLLRCA